MSFFKKLSITGVFALFVATLSLWAMEIENQGMFPLDLLPQDIKQEVVKALVKDEKVSYPDTKKTDSNVSISNLRLLNRSWRNFIDNPYMFKQIVAGMAQSKKNWKYNTIAIAQKWEKMPATQTIDFKTWLVQEFEIIELFGTFSRTVRFKDQSEVQKLLPHIKETIGINATNIQGDSFFYQAALGSELSRRNAELLLQEGADITQQNKQGQNALHCAVAINKMEVVEFLLRHKINLNLKDNEGRTSLYLATYYTNSLPIAKTFIAAGADVNIQTNEGETALMNAAYQTNLATVKELVTHGADITLQNVQGQTVLNLLKVRLGIMPEYAEILNFLETYLKNQN